MSRGKYIIFLLPFNQQIKTIETLKSFDLIKYLMRFLISNSIVKMTDKVPGI